MKTASTVAQQFQRSSSNTTTSNSTSSNTTTSNSSSKWLRLEPQRQNLNT
jgi:hypothetical protein